jgi:tRNA-specific 2-thiouridylase
LRTAAKPDSQDVCFISRTGGRETFLGNRIPFRPADVVDTSGNVTGRVEAIELVTIGQRKGLGIAGGGPKQYVVDVDTAAARVTIGDEHLLFTDSFRVTDVTWAHEGDSDRIRTTADVLVQSSAHGATSSAVLSQEDNATVRVVWSEPQRRVAPGQSVVFYDVTNRFVLGGGIACAE